MTNEKYLPVVWPAPVNHVHALTTLVDGGVSRGDFAQFNLATHVGDDVLSVQRNRQQLVCEAQLPAEPVWLDQVHSNRVVDAGECSSTEVLQADASYTAEKGVVCVVLTADCLPVFFCNTAGTEVAVAHAGWRGLHAGILSETVNAMHSSASDVMVHFGPAIGPASFEVGLDVYQAFTDKHGMYQQAFTVRDEEHYLCDIYLLAKLELQTLGMRQFSGGDYCTYIDTQHFYSYRRKPRTGRMASLIWMD